MIYTQEQLEAMRDFDINKSVAKFALSDHFRLSGNDFFPELVEVIASNGAVLKTVDYCNNWSDIGPLIDNHQISLDPRKSLNKLGWLASIDSVTYSIHKNPLRAAAIVYILIKQGE